MGHGLPGEPGADHPGLPPDMAGALDLNDPIQVMLTNFRQGVGKNGALACVAVAQMPNGSVAISFHAPGGLVQVLGMMAAASGMITTSGESQKGSQEEAE